MTGPLVSIVLPTHNRPETLVFAIESVLAQTFGDYEVLVVGDGCTDATGDVVGGFDDDRVRWLDLPKAPGFGYANRNVALREAEGRLIAYLAHDDLWTSDHLEMMVGTIERRGVEFAYSRAVTVDEQGNLWPTTCNLEGPRELSELKPDDLSIGMGTVVHTRSCLDRFGYWDESGRTGGDHRLWLRFLRGLGRSGYAFVSEPTNLHFIAAWRRQRSTWVPYRAALFRQAGVYERLLPPVLRIDVSGVDTEQEAVWGAMSTEPAVWNSEMRRAIIAVLDQRLQHVDDGIVLLIAAWAAKVQRVVSRLYRRSDLRRADRLHDDR